jgi:hypothetical protein
MGCVVQQLTEELDVSGYYLNFLARSCFTTYTQRGIILIYDYLLTPYGPFVPTCAEFGILQTLRNWILKPPRKVSCAMKSHSSTRFGFQL